MNGRLVLGHPSAGLLSRIFVEQDGRRVQIGTVREVEGRWFPIDLDGLPVEGTYRTKRAAAEALR